MISKNSFNLDGKTIVVTGANGLLGIEFTESIIEFGTSYCNRYCFKQP